MATIDNYLNPPIFGILSRCPSFIHNYPLAFSSSISSAMTAATNINAISHQLHSSFAYNRYFYNNSLIPINNLLVLSNTLAHQLDFANYFSPYFDAVNRLSELHRNFSSAFNNFNSPNKLSDLFFISSTLDGIQEPSAKSALKIINDTLKPTDLDDKNSSSLSNKLSIISTPEFLLALLYLMDVYLSLASTTQDYQLYSTYIKYANSLLYLRLIIKMLAIKK